MSVVPQLRVVRKAVSLHACVKYAHLVLGQFARLGDEVARRWQSQGNQLEVFAGVATAALAESRVLDAVDFEDVVRWALASDNMPEQRLRPFGQPPLNVYQGTNFYIELLFWIDTPTGIHDHAFSGAFGVLSGSSFHSQYHFQTAERLCPELHLGELHLDSAEILRRGDVRTIHPGNQFIHSVLHLDSPSVTLVVRTGYLPFYAPQLMYHPSGIAEHGQFKGEPQTTRAALLRMLQRTNQQLFLECAIDTIRNGDLWTAFKAVQMAANDASHWDTFARLLHVLSLRRSDLAEAMCRVPKRMRAELAITEAMRATRDPAHRFYLAMLLNVPARDMFESIVQMGYPGADHNELLTQWRTDLAALGVTLPAEPPRRPVPA